MKAKNNPFKDMKVVSKKRKKRVSPQVGNQRLLSLCIHNLKGLKNLTIDFSKSSVVGLFGPNGSGKTTILQTIVCLYRDGKKNTKMSRFFKFVNGNNWKGSKYEATFSHINYRKESKEETVSQLFSKKKSEWSPRQIAKYNREVHYIPISECLPDIEKTNATKVTYRSSKTISINAQIAKSMSTILNVQYANMFYCDMDNIHSFQLQKKSVDCHSFHLGAGEQRLLRLLEILYSAKEYSLIAIDELDVTLHTAALKRLVVEMKKIAEEKHLQIVFTSHRQELMDIKDISVYFIWNTTYGTWSIENPSSDCYDMLTGDATKVLHIYVEDDVAAEVVQKVLQQCGMCQHAEIFKMGSATNVVRLAAGIECQFEDVDDRRDDYLFVTDGDDLNFVSHDKLTAQINKVLAGSDPLLTQRRHNLERMISYFESKPSVIQHGKNMGPEEFIHDVLVNMDESTCGFPELVLDACDIAAPGNVHDYVNILTDKGYRITSIVDLFSQDINAWSNYTSHVRKWIEDRKRFHQIGVYR